MDTLISLVKAAIGAEEAFYRAVERLDARHAAYGAACAAYWHGFEELHADNIVDVAKMLLRWKKDTDKTESLLEAFPIHAPWATSVEVQLALIEHAISKRHEKRYGKPAVDSDKEEDETKHITLEMLERFKGL